MTDAAVWIAVYWLAVSAISFIQMSADKRRAKRGGRRYPERRLLLFALLGGAAGGWAGMRIFRHKTKHAAFAAGLPIMAVAHVALFTYVAFMLN